MNKVVREIVFEAAPAMCMLTFVGVLIGVMLEEVKESLTSTPALFLIVPIAMDISGDIASIMGSRLTTSLALGEVTRVLSRAFVERTLREFFAALLATEVTFVGVGGLSVFLILRVLGIGVLGLDKVALVMGLTLLIGSPLVVLLTIATGVLTYFKGLDPDNFTIPLASTLADAVAVLSLLAAAKMIGLA